MSEIPEDIRKAAKAATGGWMTVGFPEGNLALVDAVARAILAERERCALLAETHPKYRWGGWSGDPTCHHIGAAIRNPNLPGPAETA